MALGCYVCGTATASGVTSLTIPITVDVPASNPTLGASIVLVYLVFNPNVGAVTGTATDDAAPFNAYSFCNFSDGLNHYAPDQHPISGLIVNPLVAGTNSVTITGVDDGSGGPADVVAVAIALTGVGGSWGGEMQPYDISDPTGHWLLPAIANLATWPFSGPESPSTSFGVTWSDGGAPDFVAPVNTASGHEIDTNWYWDGTGTTDNLALYLVDSDDQGGDPGGWTWADGAIAALSYQAFDPGSGLFLFQAIGAQSPMTTLAQAPSVIGAYTSGGSLAGILGGGLDFAPGLGPPACTPPPVVGAPAFNRVVPIT